jgi:hypothetical protein
MDETPKVGIRGASKQERHQNVFDRLRSFKSAQQ